MFNELMLDVVNGLPSQQREEILTAEANKWLIYAMTSNPEQDGAEQRSELFELLNGHGIDDIDKYREQVLMIPIAKNIEAGAGGYWSRAERDISTCNLCGECEFTAEMHQMRTPILGCEYNVCTDCKNGRQWLNLLSGEAEYFYGSN